MHIDYARFSTYELKERTVLVGLLPAESRKATHWLQYTGVKGPHTFHGSGLQRGKAHYIAHVSGPLAHEYCADVAASTQLDHGAYVCKRIDLAHDIQTDYRPRELADRLKLNHATVTMYESSDGWTIYLNRRDSDFLVRLYRKYEREQTRLEFELKHDLAKVVWDKLSTDASARALLDVWGSLLARAKLTPGLASDFALDKEDHERISAPHKSSTIEGRIEWMYQALGAIERLANDHEATDRVVDAVGTFAAQLIAKHTGWI